MKSIRVQEQQQQVQDTRDRREAFREEKWKGRKTSTPTERKSISENLIKIHYPNPTYGLEKKRKLHFPNGKVILTNGINLLKEHPSMRRVFARRRRLFKQYIPFVY